MQQIDGSIIVMLAALVVPIFAHTSVAMGDLPNDSCSSASVVIEGNPAAEGDNALASDVDDAEASCRFSDFDVWFEYVATCTGAVTVDTFGSGQEDTVLSVYDVCGGDEIACDDDTGGTLSQVSFAATSGQSYWIRLASLGVPGDYDLNISCSRVPGNDSCATATLVTDGLPAAEGDNSGAGATDDAEASCRASDNDVWFEYVATCTGTVMADTFGSGQEDTVLSAYDACGGNEIACNDDTGGTLSQVSFAATSGQSYWIRLASLGVPGDYDLNITCDGVPGNDNCASATLVSDGIPSAEGDNSGASATDDAEASCRASDNDVWFEYVATCTGTLIIDTFGSGQPDTVLSVYDACGGPEIACNDDSGGLLSQLMFDATTGQSHWIRLASVAPPGDFDLNIACSGFPGNDDCASAQAVTDGTPAAEGDNSQAGASNDTEASCYPPAGGDVWFEYVATCTGTLIIDTFGSGQPDTVLSVYGSCGGSEIACNDDTGGTLSQVSLAATFGQSYLIQLASFAVPGDYDLNISCTDLPTNDDCASALIVTEGSPAVGGDNSPASDVDDAEASCRQSSSKDVWFEYVAGCTGSATVDTFASGQEDTVLSVYDSCGGAEIACNDDTGGTLSQVMFDTTFGQSYWIRLASVAQPGDFDLNISCAGFPGNDDCASALIVMEGTPAAQGDNSQASASDDAEASCSPPSSRDVWFKHRAACSGTLSIDTFSSGQPDTVISVYDSCGGAEIACNDDSGGTLSEVSFVATPGQFYWIRLASFGPPGDYDLNIVNVNAFPEKCLPEVVQLPGPPHDVPKHRYLSFDTSTNPSEEVAFKVELVSMRRCSGQTSRACTVDDDCEATVPGSGTCVQHPDVGTAGPWWVQTPQQEPQGCIPGPCGGEDWFARVGGTPHFDTWTLNTLHIGDCEIIPVATYEVRACLLPDGTLCGDPLTIGTIGQPFVAPGFRGNYGDVVGAVDVITEEFAPPDGFTNVVDVSAYILTNQNYGTDNTPQTHPTWVDLHGLGDGNPPQYILNVSDLTQIKKAFAGHAWTDDPGNMNPGQCP